MTCSINPQMAVSNLVDMQRQSLFILLIYLSGHPPTQTSLHSELLHTFKNLTFKSALFGKLFSESKEDVLTINIQ